MPLSNLTRRSHRVCKKRSCRKSQLGNLPASPARSESRSAVKSRALVKAVAAVPVPALSPGRIAAGLNSPLAIVESSRVCPRPAPTSFAAVVVSRVPAIAMRVARNGERTRRKQEKTRVYAKQPPRVRAKIQKHVSNPCWPTSICTTRYIRSETSAYRQTEMRSAAPINRCCLRSR